MSSRAAYVIFFTTVLAGLLSPAVASASGRRLAQAASSGNTTAVAEQLPLPLAKVHSHNDYEHPYPLYTALANGVCSIEADPWLVNGTLYVAHDANQILRVNAVGKPLSTLEEMYIAPLAMMYHAQGGYIYPASKYTGICESVILLIDFKGAAYFDKTTGNYTANTTDVGINQFEVLEELLGEYQAEYPGLFTMWNNGIVVPGAINAYISGSRPDPAYVLKRSVRHSALDGRLIDLNNAYPPTVYPLISQGWCCGDGTVLANWTAYSRYEFASQSVVPVPESLTPDQYTYVSSLVQAAHSQGRIIRFWATPDTVKFWNLGFDIGEDLVNTDQLKPIHDFVTGKLASSSVPMGTAAYA